MTISGVSCSDFMLIVGAALRHVILTQGSSPGKKSVWVFFFFFFFLFFFIIIPGNEEENSQFTSS